MSHNPWDSGAFQLQICAIILAPTIICISLYLTLKRITGVLNPDLSRIRPRLYPFLFCPADVTCLVVQAIGGGLAASGKTNVKLLNDGNHMIIAGVALQVVVLLAFGGLSADYIIRARRWVNSAEATDEARALWEDKRFRIFRFTTMVAYICVQIRCVYRIAEFAKVSQVPFFLFHYSQTMPVRGVILCPLGYLADLIFWILGMGKLHYAR